MGFLRQQRCAAIARAGRARPTFWRASYLGLAGFVLLLTAASAQTVTLPSNSSGNGILTKCGCGDWARLQDRLQKLKGVELLIANKLQSTAAGTPASQHDWAALQGQIRSYLQAMQIQGLTTFPDTSLFLGNGDPFCGTQMISAGACLDQDFAVHQTGHAASCRAGNWNWQTAWTDSAMFLEEAAAIQKEMDAIRETIKRLGCGTQSGNPVSTAPPAQPTQPSAARPQFMLLVQVVTTSSVNMPGALTEQSSRSLNNGQGIRVPLVFHTDGTFEGFGSGVDSGSALGASSGEVVSGHFGHMQSIAASGFIRPGSCNTQPCQPDIMHLVLVGGPAQQMTQMQARGWVNRDIQQTTPTGVARLEFDLPAYVGGSAQRTFFATGILNSGMTVVLAQMDNGAPALPEGGSLLYSLQQGNVANLKLNSNSAGAGVDISSLVPGGIPNQSGNQVSNPPADRPATPAWIKTTVIPSANGVGQIKVDWSAVDTATSYNIYRNLIYPDSAPTEQKFTVSGNSTSYVDASAPLFIAAVYSVTAVNSAGESARRDAPATRAVPASR